MITKPTLWKFTSVEAFKNLLRTKTVAVRPALDMNINDPGEFKARIKDYTRGTFDTEISNPKIFAKLAPSIATFLNRKKLSSPRSLSSSDKMKIFDFVKHEVETLNHNAKRFKYLFSQEFGIFSCCKDNSQENGQILSPVDNPVIWAHYASAHHGLAYNLNDDFFLGRQIFRKVAYLRDAPVLSIGLKELESVGPSPGTWNSGMEFFRPLTFSKHTTWKYESEHRVLYPLYKAVYDSEHDLYRAGIKPKSIFQVIFGCRTPERDIREIRHLAKDFNSSIFFGKTVEDPSSYKLQRFYFPIRENSKPSFIPSAEGPIS